jgi:hypothetical protein
MNKFFEKNRKVLTTIFIILLVVAVGVILNFFVLKDKNTADVDTGTEKVEQSESSNQPVIEESEEAPIPEYTTESSSKVISETYEAAKKWSSDVKLYDCTAIPATFTYSDTTYEFVGADSGKYYNWNCTYYSPSKAQIKIFTYTDGKMRESADAIDIEEYELSRYSDIEYPSNLSDIVDSTEIYAKVVKEGLNNESNYVSMYLRDTVDYGFVWKVEERSRTQKDEYDMGLIENIYIYDISSGELIEKSITVFSD